MGVFEMDAFAKGTNAIATTLAELTGKVKRVAIAASYHVFHTDDLIRLVCHHHRHSPHHCHHN